MGESAFSQKHRRRRYRHRCRRVVPGIVTVAIPDGLTPYHHHGRDSFLFLYHLCLETDEGTARKTIVFRASIHQVSDVPPARRARYGVEPSNDAVRVQSNRGCHLLGAPTELPCFSFSVRRPTKPVLSSLTRVPQNSFFTPFPSLVICEPPFLVPFPLAPHHDWRPFHHRLLVGWH